MNRLCEYQALKWQKHAEGKRRKQMNKAAESTVGYVTNCQDKTPNFTNYSIYDENSAPAVSIYHETQTLYP
jgi:hypothetical protein